MHFPAGSKERWHEIGDLFAPKEFWKETLGDSPGLRSLTIEGTRPGSKCTRLFIKVEPSVKVEHGVYVNSNEHYQLNEDEGVSHLLDILKSEWEDAQAYANTVAERLLSHKAR